MEKIDLTDVTLTIPVRYDTDDRIENLKFVIEYIRNFFNINIMVLEESKEKKFDWVDAEYIFVETETSNLHRTKCLNEMAKKCNTPIIVNYDTDVVFLPKAYKKSRDLLIKNEADMIYPYAGKFIDVPRKYIDALRKNKYDISIIKENDKHVNHPESLGGAIFWNKNKFFEFGMENQKFKSWGWEDNERFYRAKKLGMRIKRVDGELIHIEHKRLEDSKPNNRHYKNNMNEFYAIKNMSPGNLKKHMKKWKWLKN